MPVSVESILPHLVMFAMTIVGLELTLPDLLRVLRFPLHTGIALLGQVVLLPLVGVGLIVALDLDATVAGGLILVAAASQAPMSNYFCVLARADVALSVTLTAISSVVAMFTMPWVTRAAFAWLAHSSEAVHLPPGAMMRQIALGLLLPIAVGMVIRHLAPAFVERQRARLQWASLLALVGILALIVVDQAATITAHLAGLVLASALFTAIAAALGAGLATLFGWSHLHRITMVAAFPARSLSMATLVAVGILGRMEFLSFAVVFFVVQALLLVPLMLRARAQLHPAGVDAR
jgi:BASS family bile acid:Na+ symporter